MALMAAIPVGASTINFFLTISQRCFRNVDLPVPAFPVRKTDCRVRVIKSKALLNSGLDVSIIGVKIYQFEYHDKGIKKPRIRI